MELYAASLLQHEYYFLVTECQAIFTMNSAIDCTVNPYLPNKLVSILWWNFFVNSGSSCFFSPKYTMCTWNVRLSNACVERKVKIDLELKLEIIERNSPYSLYMWHRLLYTDDVELRSEREPPKSSSFLHKSRFLYWNPSTLEGESSYELLHVSLILLQVSKHFIKQPSLHLHIIM